MPAPALARLTSPGEVLAVLPQLCGFLPADSLVVVSLRGPRRRVGLTARLDLPDPRGEAAAALLLAERMAADGAAAVVVAVYDGPRREALVAALQEACDLLGLQVAEALHVDGGRWTSYTCAGPCCPPEGTPLDADTPAVRLVAAERTAAGRAVLTSREALVASVAPPAGEALDQAQQRDLEAARTEQHLRRERGATAARQRTRQHAAALLDRAAEGGVLSAPDAARLAAGVDDVLARDELATLLLTRPDELLALLLQAVRLVAAPADAPLCALLAWVAYARGDGALVNVALDRALASRPAYSLALLLRTCLDAGLPPDDVRAVAARTAEALTDRRPASWPG